MKYSLIPVVLISLCIASLPRSVKSPRYEIVKGVILSVISRRWIPKSQVPYVGDDVIDFSDMIVRFRLENRGRQDFYYLADNVLEGIQPVGFQLRRKQRNSEWEALYTPARGREDVFTEDSCRWFRLPSGCAIEFEREDVSYEKGQHAGSVFVNTEPEHKNRVEIISDSYLSLRNRRRN